MNRIVIYTLLLLILAACGGVKKSEKALARGNYDQVITQTISNLKTNKSAKRKKPYISLLKVSFTKAVDRDRRRLALLEKENNTNTLQERYQILNTLIDRQERIRPLLPLPGVSFSFADYTDNLLDSKQALSAHLLEASKEALRSSNKNTIRQAYDDLVYLNSINPGYGNCLALADQALALGKSYVRLTLKNRSGMMLPVALEEDLLNVDTQMLNNKWIEYHNRPFKDFEYDYDMIIAFRSIQVSPEQLIERIIPQEKRVRDGFEYVLDENGNVKKDSLGNDIKVDKFKTIKANYYEHKQFKSAAVDAQIDIIDLNSNQLSETFPMQSEFLFDHIYADFDGEKEAIDRILLPNLRARPVPFPSDEQMVYDAGEDIKAQLKNILSRERILD